MLLFYDKYISIFAYSARSHLASHINHPTVENQRYRCSFMQTAHYSISEIIIADTTDNDAIGKNRIIRLYGQAIYAHLFNIQ